MKTAAIARVMSLHAGLRDAGWRGPWKSFCSCCTAQKKGEKERILTRRHSSLRHFSLQSNQEALYTHVTGDLWNGLGASDVGCGFSHLLLLFFGLWYSSIEIISVSFVFSLTLSLDYAIYYCRDSCITGSCKIVISNHIQTYK